MKIKIYEYDLGMPTTCWYCAEPLREGEPYYVDDEGNYYCSLSCASGEPDE